MRSAAQRSGKSLLRAEAAIAALQARENDFALDLLQSLQLGKEHWAPQMMALRRLLETVPPQTWERARLIDDPAKEMQVVTTPGADITLVVFLTLNGNFTMLPVEMLDALLSSLPANVIYLRDTSSMLQGANGYRTLGSSPSLSVAAIATELAAIGASRTLAVGGSASGLSAIRYGARLGAERVVGFGAMTALAPRRRPRNSHASAGASRDSRDRFGTVEEEMAAAPGLVVDLYYGADYARDCERVERVAGLPGIRLLPLAGVDHHYCALEMIADETFLDAIMPSS
ncbi:hypothetical protein [Jiella sonneratiae]|uniref:Alpha/beta hydrolase n=1 Tax=Jiella sonneratiae TaxID=2816856 RepID=A0ABS3J161_9HYPH|nr:hypothetical protein [Jiella sonneratiae]MBO0903407.1 hypothetical protein [Jiella sonneratiae]